MKYQNYYAMKSKRPNIFIVDSANTIFDYAVDRLEEIKSRIDGYSNIDGIIAAYLYGYSIYEGALFQIYKIFAKAFPDRMEIEFKKEYKNTILENTQMSFLLKTICDDFSKKIGHKDFGKLIQQFGSIIAINLDISALPKSEMDQFKINRDRLAHRGMIDFTVPKNSGRFDFKIQDSDVLSHIDAAIATLRYIQKKINYAYAKYSREYLIRESCRYIFRMGEGGFNKCFYFKDSKFRINAKEIEYWYFSACSSERHLFLLFIVNFGLGFSKELKLEDLRPTVSLDYESINKVAYINDLFMEYPHLINN